MNLSKDKERVFCHKCNKWLDIFTETYPDGDMILCLIDDELLGYKWDLPKEKEEEND